MEHTLNQTVIIYALAIAISMVVAVMIKGLNKVICHFESTPEQSSTASSKSAGKVG